MRKQALNVVGAEEEHDPARYTQYGYDLAANKDDETRSYSHRKGSMREKVNYEKILTARSHFVHARRSLQH